MGLEQTGDGVERRKDIRLSVLSALATAGKRPLTEEVLPDARDRAAAAIAAE